jgi:hypothetical protein
MRKILTMVTALAVAVPVSIAGAAKPDNPGKPDPAKGSKPKVCKPAPKRGVTFIARGVLVKDATATDMVVEVTSVNKHAKTALAGPGAKGGGAYSVPMLTVKIDACSRITRSGKGASKRSYTSLKTGDRVVVAWSAKPGTTYADLGAARRVVDRGPASQ